MNPPDSSNSGSTNPRRERGISFDRHRRSSRSPPLKFAASSRDYEARHHQFKKPRPRIDGAGGGGGGADEGASASPAGAATAKGLRIEEPKESSRSSPIRSDSGKLPRLRGGEKKEPRAKFTVSLSRKEIEDDFMAMIGHRPARRPKKRPRIVQKQMDTLFPGLWLGEVTVDSYKVPEIPDIGKVN
ncbi:unnamed protein product [Linum tenue]|uniref:DUF1639 family protein n=1 Tax=Linum tenue TaxID=586396 RepID=A0AAV0N7Y4_9ROSI|nr:unnamed protein product [Linum tenue]